MVEKEKTKIKKSLLLVAWASSLKEHYQYRDWVPFFKSKFSKFSSFSTRDFYFRYGIEKLNEHFLELIKNEKPDYLLMSLSYDELWPQTLQRIKSVCPNTTIIGFFGDDHWRFDDWSRYYAQFFDYILTSEKDTNFYEQEGFNNAQFLHGVSQSVFHKDEKIEKIYDLTFVGMPIRDRVEYLRYLKSKGFKLKIFGRGWNKYPDLSDVYGGFLETDKYVDLINQTKINLSFSKTLLEEKGKKNTQLKGRLFEVAACKAFMLVEDFTDFNKFFPNSKNITFSNKEGLVKKAEYFLRNELARKSESEKIYSQVLKEYTWEAQFNKFFNKIINKKKPGSPEIKSNGGVIELNKKDLNLPRANLIAKLRDVDFISFNDGVSAQNSFKNNFHSQCLVYSGKQISCSDSYGFNNLLGNFALSMVKKAVKSRKCRTYASLLNLSQIAVKREFFLDNFEKFKRFNLKDRVWMLDAAHTAFISIPLVSIRRNPTLEDTDSDYSRPLFLDKLYSVWLRRGFFSIKFLSLITAIALYPPVYQIICKSLNDRSIWHKLKNTF